MLNKCCGNNNSSCWQVMYQPPETDPEQLLRVPRDSHVIYPVLVDKQDAADEKLNMIGLIPPASIAFVVPKGKRESYPKKLLMSVFEAWPVLILTILLSILAGAFLWVLVSGMAYNVSSRRSVSWEAARKTRKTGLARRTSTYNAASFGGKREF